MDIGVGYSHPFLLARGFSMIDNTTIVYTNRSAESFTTESTEVTKNGAKTVSFIAVLLP